MNDVTLQAVRGYLEYGEKTPNQAALTYDLKKVFYGAGRADSETFSQKLKTYFSAPCFPSVAEIAKTNISPEVVVLSRLNHLNVKFLALSAYFMMHEKTAQQGVEHKTMRFKDGVVAQYKNAYPALQDAWALVNTKFTLATLKAAAHNDAVHLSVPHIIADAADLNTQAGIVFGAYVKALDTRFYL